MTEAPNWFERALFKTFNFAGSVAGSLAKHARGDFCQVLISSVGTGICGFGLTSGLVLGMTSSVLKHLLYKHLFFWIEKNEKGTVKDKDPTRITQKQFLTEEASGLLYVGLFLFQWLVPMQACRILLLPRIEDWVNQSSLVQFFPTLLTLNSGLILAHPFWLAFSSFLPALMTPVVLTFNKE